MVLSTAAIFLSFFLEYLYLLDLCIFCTLQRTTIIFLWATYLVAYIHKTNLLFTYAYGFCATIFSSIGVVLAARLVWIQSFAVDKSGSCTAGIMKILDFYPWADAINIIWKASSCAEEVFTIGGVSLAIWSLCLFVLLLFLSILALYFIFITLTHHD